MDSVWGGVEAGGTKFVCVVGRGPDEIVDTTRFATTLPEETLGRVIDFFRPYHKRSQLKALGVASFGPVDLDRNSPAYGSITSTPKPGWANTSLVAPLAAALGVPVAFDTDVNGAALGEGRWGQARGLRNYVYLTVGTGIGGGAVIEGELLHGLVHPEMGHMWVRRHPDDEFAGSCPYHRDCLEGLAAGPALAARWSRPGHELPDDHPAWALEAYYLAQAVCNLVVVLSPERVILGGGILHRPGLLAMIRTGTRDLLAGYVRASAVTDEIEQFIVRPGLGEHSGALGALALALDERA